MKYNLSILGCRGIPAQHGGFETFAERLSLYLTDKGWSVNVYCQAEKTDKVEEKYWKGIRIIYIPVPVERGLGSVIFDWKSILHCIQEDTIVLTLGYNTAVFSFWHRLKGQINLINMDGLEWLRKKWKIPEKLWLYLNDWCGCWLANHLIADHPEIEKVLISRVPSSKVSLIPYGAEPVTEANISLLKPYNLAPNQYILVIARTEPENNLLEIVSAFSSRKQGLKLVILGRYLPEIFPYHQQILEAASDEVKFLGTIYDTSIVNTLRFYARLYIHGHSVGGTNPSLVEALACSCAVLAHDNLFNRWVAGKGAHYFQDQLDCAQKLEELLHNKEKLVLMKKSSWQRYQEDFSGQKDLQAYENLLIQFWNKNKLKN